MHYYQFSIGDYRAATTHLSNEEDLAYRRLLDMYYDTEKPIPTDTTWVARRLRVGVNVVISVLEDMFKPTDEGWRHARCDDVIAQYHAMAEKNRANGKRGGRKKNPVGSESHPIAKATINHEQVNQELNEVLQGSPIPAILDCPHSEILRLWAEKLPTAIQPADWNEKRQQLLRSRWREKKNRQDIDWWQRLFEYIEKSDFLMGRVNANGRKAFSLSLDWLCKSDNFLKVIEGKYHEAEVQA